MKELNLKITGTGYTPLVYVDGKQQKLTKNKYGAYEATHMTENDKVEISVYRVLELQSKLWFLMSIVFFIIGLLGIVDPRYDKKCVVLDCKFNLTLKEEKTNASLAFASPVPDRSAFKIQTNGEYEEISNKFVVDTKALKRRKAMLITKIMLWIVGIIATVVILVMK